MSEIWAEEGEGREERWREVNWLFVLMILALLFSRFWLESALLNFVGFRWEKVRLDESSYLIIGPRGKSFQDLFVICPGGLASYKYPRFTYLALGLEGNVIVAYPRWKNPLKPNSYQNRLRKLLRVLLKEERDVIVIGHSEGSRVAVSSLLNLGLSNTSNGREVKLLLGGTGAEGNLSWLRNFDILPLMVIEVSDELHPLWELKALGALKGEHLVSLNADHIAFPYDLEVLSRALNRPIATLPFLVLSFLLILDLASTFVVIRLGEELERRGRVNQATIGVSVFLLWITHVLIYKIPSPAYESSLFLLILSSLMVKYVTEKWSFKVPSLLLIGLGLIFVEWKLATLTFLSSPALYLRSLIFNIYTYPLLTLDIGDLISSVLATPLGGIAILFVISPLGRNYVLRRTHELLQWLRATGYTKLLIPLAISLTLVNLSYLLIPFLLNPLKGYPPLLDPLRVLFLTLRFLNLTFLALIYIKLSMEFSPS